MTSLSEDSGASPVAAGMAVLLLALAGAASLVYLATEPRATVTVERDEGPIFDLRPRADASWVELRHVQGPSVYIHDVRVWVDGNHSTICHRPALPCEAVEGTFRVGDRAYLRCEKAGPSMFVIKLGEETRGAETVQCRRGAS